MLRKNDSGARAVRRDPLKKRIWRDIRRDWGKYLAIFLFLTVFIGFESGYIIADTSMQIAYHDGMTNCHVESGHFVMQEEANEDLLDKIEREEVAVSEQFYLDKASNGTDTIRIYKMREEGGVNEACLLDGAFPEADDEIAIDRLYAENNGIGIGDEIRAGGSTLTVCGLVALPDYSCLYKNNSDMMFNANHFSVGLVTEEGFDGLGTGGLSYCYVWYNDDRSLDLKERNEKAEDIKDVIVRDIGRTGNMLDDFVQNDDNNAIQFAGDDMSDDKAMFSAMLYIIVLVLAFIMAMLAKSTLEQESQAIGTLRASGYTRSELVRHYMTAPLIVSLIAALLGNVLGYTAMKWVVVRMYYNSYSLPDYVTVWSAEAFIKTTLVPLALVALVTWFVLHRALKIPPLQFLRGELKHSKKNKVMHLKRGSFMTRYRERVLFQNIPSYIVLVLGISFAGLLLYFGLGMQPLMDHFKENVLTSQIAEYQYVLRAPVEVEDEQAEKYSAATLEQPGYGEEIMLFGIEEDSDYLTDAEMPDNGQAKEDVREDGAFVPGWVTDRAAAEMEDKPAFKVLASEGYMEKYQCEVGDIIRLQEKYEDRTYRFEIVGTYQYDAALALFLDRESLNACFGRDADAFNGYFSDEELTELDEDDIATIVRENDLTAIADQLEDSFAEIFPMFTWFAVVMYLLLMYLLGRMVIERNAKNISMLKILGYNDREVSRLYNHATGIVAVGAVILTIPLVEMIFRVIWRYVMFELSGWLTFYEPPSFYLKMVCFGIVSYAAVYLLQMRKVRRIPMGEALKSME